MKKNFSFSACMTTHPAGFPKARGRTKGDLDTNGIVDRQDLELLRANWGANDGGPSDLDGDGSVGVSDLLALLANWGPCP